MQTTNLLASLTPQNTATIAIDCLNTFMKANGKLSLSYYQKLNKGKNQELVQQEIDNVAQNMGKLRQFLYQQQIPQIQFQDAHVIESIHGKRFHSLEIVRNGETPDFIRSFPPHALLEKHRRFGTPDQQAIDEIQLPKTCKQILIPWFETSLPTNAQVHPNTELIFLKDDFCMSPGNPHVHSLLWELRRQGRFNLIVFGVCDDVCNLRNVILLLSAVFNIIYPHDCTYPLDPDKRKPAINYMQQFNPLGSPYTGQFQLVHSQDIIQHFQP